MTECVVTLFPVSSLHARSALPTREHGSGGSGPHSAAPEDGERAVERAPALRLRPSRACARECARRDSSRTPAVDEGLGGEWGQNKIPRPMPRAPPLPQSPHDDGRAAANQQPTIYVEGADSSATLADSTNSLLTDVCRALSTWRLWGWLGPVPQAPSIGIRRPMPPCPPASGLWRQARDSVCPGRPFAQWGIVFGVFGALCGVRDIAAPLECLPGLHPALGHVSLFQGDWRLPAVLQQWAAHMALRTGTTQHVGPGHERAPGRVRAFCTCAGAIPHIGRSACGEGGGEALMTEGPNITRPRSDQNWAAQRCRREVLRSPSPMTHTSK